MRVKEEDVMEETASDVPESSSSLFHNLVVSALALWAAKGQVLLF